MKLIRFYKLCLSARCCAASYTSLSALAPTTIISISVFVLINLYTIRIPALYLICSPNNQGLWQKPKPFDNVSLPHIVKRA